jgi:HSP20 family molecular chaperone IbpA
MGYMTGPTVGSPRPAQICEEEKGELVMAEKSMAVQVAKEPPSVEPLALENVFDPANAIFNAMSKRAYEILDGNGRRLGHELDDWFQAEEELLHPVHIGIQESEDALSIHAEVPGFSQNELEINVEPRRLIISGKRDTKKEEKKGRQSTPRRAP